MLHFTLAYLPLVIGVYLFAGCCYGARTEHHPDVRGAAAQSGGLLLLLGLMFSHALSDDPLDLEFVVNLLAFITLSASIVAASTSATMRPLWRWALTALLVAVTLSAWGAHP